MPRGVSLYDEARLQGRLWTPGCLGALDRVRVEFSDIGSIVPAASGKIAGIKNKGSLGTLADFTSTSNPGYANGIVTTGGGVTLFTSQSLSAAQVFANRQTGIFYGIVQFISGTVWFKWEVNGTGNRLGFESASRVDWASDSAGSLAGWSPTLSTPRVLVVQKTPTGKNVWLNGVIAATQNETTSIVAGASSQMVIGANTPAGAIPAVATFRGALGMIDDYSLTTVQRVTAWLAHMMAGAGDQTYLNALAANSPFKNRPPLIGD